MTLSADEEKFAGRERLEYGGLEGDKLLKLCGLSR